MRGQVLQLGLQLALPEVQAPLRIVRLALRPAVGVRNTASAAAEAEAVAAGEVWRQEGKGFCEFGRPRGRERASPAINQSRSQVTPTISAPILCTRQFCGG